MGFFSNMISRAARSKMGRTIIGKIEQENLSYEKAAKELDTYSAYMENIERDLVSKIVRYDVDDRARTGYRTQRRKALQQIEATRGKLGLSAVSSNINDLKKSHENKELSAAEQSQVKALEDELKVQFNDIAKLITLLDDLIKNENRELVLDLKRPFGTFREYLAKLELALANIAIPYNLLEDVFKELNTIKDMCDTLASKLANIVNTEFTNRPTVSNMNLDSALKNRVYMRKQLSAMTASIKNSLNSLDKKFMALRDNTVFTNNLKSTAELDLIRGNITTFKDVFKRLSDLFSARLDLSDHIVVSAVAMQKDKYREMAQITDELKHYPEISAQFSEFTKNMATSFAELETKEVKGMRLDHDKAQELVSTVAKEHTAIRLSLNNAERTLAEVNAENNKILTDVGRFLGRAAAVLLMVTSVELVAPIVTSYLVGKDTEHSEHIVVMGSESQLAAFEKNPRLAIAEAQNESGVNFVMPETMNVDKERTQGFVTVSQEAEFTINLDDLHNFSAIFNGAEGPIDTTSLTQNFDRRYTQEYQKMIDSLKIKAGALMKEKGLSNYEINKYLDTTGVIVSVDSLNALATTCPLGGYVVHNGKGNQELSKVRLGNTVDRLKEHMDSLGIKTPDIKSKWSMRAIGMDLADTSVQNSVIEVDNYLNGLSSVEKSELFQRMKTYGVKIKSESEMFIDYVSMKNKGDGLHRANVGKFDVITKYMLEHNPALYNKIKNSMNHLRKVKIMIKFKAKLPVKYRQIFFVPDHDAILAPPPIPNRVGVELDYASKHDVMSGHDPYKTHGIPRSEPSMTGSGRGADISGRR